MPGIYFQKTAVPFDSPLIGGLEWQTVVMKEPELISKSEPVEVETTLPRATYQDVIDAPPHMTAEIVDGVLYTNPRPAPRHIEAHTGLKGNVVPAFHFGRGGPGGWRIYTEPELHLGEDIIVPDLAGWRLERMPELPTEAFFSLAPDWACEILSPSTRRLDLHCKRAVYAREGVPYLWFVDPFERSLAAYELRRTEWVLIDKLLDDAAVSLPPFETISFSLGDLWSQPRVHKSLPQEESGGAAVLAESESINA